MTTYITVKQSPMYRQMTLDEYLFGNTVKGNVILNSNTTNTRTYTTERVNVNILLNTDVVGMIRALDEFNESVAELRSAERQTLYKTFHIPKKSRGYRRIDAPLPELKNALDRLKTIFETKFGVLYHTSAFAYVRGRCTVDAVKRHQKNESRWFGKYDLSDFFGNTTLEFVMKMFSMIYPFSEVVKIPHGKEALEEALSLAFLNGGLPQGTPISPLITNVIMIPVDHKLANTLNDYESQHFVYTRYADDFLVSSKYSFSYRDIENLIVSVLSSFEAPFTINSRKTRYGSSSGSNWNLGVMLNKDNNITVGNKKKRQLQSALHSYATDKMNGVNWDLNDVQVLNGHISYYRSVEGETIDRIIEHTGKKLNINILELIKTDLKS